MSKQSERENNINLNPIRQSLMGYSWGLGIFEAHAGFFSINGQKITKGNLSALESEGAYVRGSARRSCMQLEELIEFYQVYFNCIKKMHEKINAPLPSKLLLEIIGTHVLMENKEATQAWIQNFGEVLDSADLAILLGVCFSKKIHWNEVWDWAKNHTAFEVDKVAFEALRNGYPRMDEARVEGLIEKLKPDQMQRLIAQAPVSFGAKVSNWDWEGLLMRWSMQHGLMALRVLKNSKETLSEAIAESEAIWHQDDPVEEKHMLKVVSQCIEHLNNDRLLQNKVKDAQVGKGLNQEAMDVKVSKRMRL